MTTKTTNPTTTTKTTIDQKDINTILDHPDMSKSERMRKLYDLGCEIGSISKLMNVRYNFVYNVISQSCRTSGIEIRTSSNGESVKSKIVSLLNEGIQPVEVSKQLQCNITMVYKYRKELENGLI